jgi:hypothetical protein
LAAFESPLFGEGMSGGAFKPVCLSQNGGGRLTAFLAFMDAQGKGSETAPIFGGVSADAWWLRGGSACFGGFVAGESDSCAGPGLVLSAFAGIISSVACQINP